jgi:predicted RNA-binding Zn-ribbon protein involved in translation (DUF1610 family)
MTTDNDSSGSEYEDPEDSVCSDFCVGSEHDVQEGTDEFVWSFECSRCGELTPCTGNPRQFGGRPYSCAHCGWVSLLDGEAINRFAKEHYAAPDTEQ